MLAAMSSQQLAAWQAFYDLDPWGEQRADLRNGIVAHVTANAFRSKTSRTFTPSDFMPKFDAEPAKPLDWQEAKSKMFAVLGSKVRKVSRKQYEEEKTARQLKRRWREERAATTGR